MTLLVRSRMPPALAQRIARRVTGRGPTTRGTALAVRLALRAVIALVVVATVALGFGSCRARARQRDAEARVIDARRERLRASVAAATGADDLRLAPGLVGEVEHLLLRLAAGSEAEHVADALRTGLDATLRRPMLYVRGPLASFADVAGIRAAAATSMKDALVLCLLSPPDARTEAAVLARARRAYGRLLPLEEATANVRRLHELEAGVPFLLPSFGERVALAHDGAELAALERALETAPVVEARRAARAELLLAAFDEPGDGHGPTEIDGERPHDVRVVLAEVATGTTLLRLRRHVDPAWASSAARSQYASGLDACALAYDLRAAVAKR